MLAALGVLVALWPGAAVAAERRVVIGEAGFDPAVIVVAPGTEVRWRNDDSRPRALRGDFELAEVAPGAVGGRVFPDVGHFAYRDRDNRAMEGTVIVAARGGRAPRYPPPPGGGDGIVEHRWRATLLMELRETWKYYDGSYGSFEGPCNAQVGTGSRNVAFAASFPDVLYQRTGSIEILTGESRPTRIRRYRERIDSRSSDPGSGRFVDCGGGVEDVEPDVEQRCDNDYGGRRVRADLSWSPTATRGRFLWGHEYLGTPPPFDGNCGNSFLSSVQTGRLPFDPGAGDPLLYDAGRTAPLSLADVRALRDGRAVTVVRSIELHFTRDCCQGWHEPSKPGTYVRAGARYDVFAKLTLRLAPL